MILLLIRGGAFYSDSWGVLNLGSRCRNPAPVHSDYYGLRVIMRSQK